MSPASVLAVLTAVVVAYLFPLLVVMAVWSLLGSDMAAAPDNYSGLATAFFWYFWVIAPLGCGYIGASRAPNRPLMHGLVSGAAAVAVWILRGQFERTEPVTLAVAYVALSLILSLLGAWHFVRRNPPGV